MSVAATANEVQERTFQVKAPGHEVNAFGSEMHFQSRVCLATDEQILFDLIYGSQIRDPYYAQAYRKVRAKILENPYLIEEIFALLRVHRESNEHRRLFPGFNALEQFEAMLLSFGEKYPGFQKKIVEGFIELEIDLTGLSDVMSSHNFKNVANAIIAFDYCPTEYLPRLFSYCPRAKTSELLQRVLAHAGEQAVEELVSRMKEFPTACWEWALLELSIVYPDFTTRFSSLIPVAMEQAVYLDSDGWEGSNRPISSTLFGPKTRENLFCRWENAGAKSGTGNALAQRTGSEFALAALGDVPVLIQDFSESTFRKLAIMGVIRRLLILKKDSGDNENPFWNKLAYIPNLNVEYAWTLELVVSEDLMIQRNALSLLCLFLRHHTCTDEIRFRAMKVLSSLPKTGVPSDRELRLAICVEVLRTVLPRISEQVVNVEDDPSSSQVRAMVKVIHMSNSLRHSYLGLIDPQERNESAFQPRISWKKDFRTRKLLSEDELENVRSMRASRSVDFFSYALKYLHAMYEEVIQCDQEIATSMISQLERRM